VGGIFVSAEIIPFIPRQLRRNLPVNFPGASRSAIQLDDLTMDHVDTAPCEYLVSGDDVTDAKDHY
jgi:hypothetical protein